MLCKLAKCIQLTHLVLEEDVWYGRCPWKHELRHVRDTTECVLHYQSHQTGGGGIHNTTCDQRKLYSFYFGKYNRFLIQKGKTVDMVLPNNYRMQY